MLILGISILFITTLNYVLISISSLSRRAKVLVFINAAERERVLFWYVYVGNRYYYFAFIVFDGFFNV